MNNIETICKVLEKMNKSQHESFRKLREELKNNSAGKLYMYQKRGKNYFIEVKDGQRKGITKNKKLLHKVARKEYLQVQVNVTANILKRIEELIEYAKEGQKKISKVKECLDVYDSTMIVKSATNRKWENDNYDRNLYNCEQLKYLTKGGVYVRSKSELIIANRLEEWGIAYRYEWGRVINGRKYYPDFTILCDDGRIIIWEHFGLMDAEEGYYKNAIYKIKEYRKAGFVQHTNLICTYEEDLIDVNKIDEIIERFILRP